MSIEKGIFKRTELLVGEKAFKLNVANTKLEY